MSLYNDEQGFSSSGVWTPVDISGAGLILVVDSCRWVRTGDIVHAFFRITYPSTVSGTICLIGGVPWTANNPATMVHGGYLTYTSFGSALTILFGSAGTSFRFGDFSGNSKTNANLSAKEMRGVLIYEAIVN